MSRRKARAGFALNPDAAGELLDTGAARALLEEVGQAAVHNIRRASPELTGRFKQSINSEFRPNVDGKPAVVVYSTSPLWHLLEYGTANMTPRRPFARGMKAAGLDYRPTPKGG